MNDLFLPDRSPLGIIHVMALIEHHRLHIGQGIIPLIDFRVKHVAEDLSGHHHHLGVAVDAQIARHQSDILGTELVAEITQLLIGESSLQSEVA